MLVRELLGGHTFRQEVTLLPTALESHEKLITGPFPDHFPEDGRSGMGPLHQ